MPPRGGIRTSLSFSVSNGATIVNAFQPSAGMLSPGLPLVPPQPQPTRVFDFQVGVNTVINPRGGYGDVHSFASLRAYANVEPVRLAIETCKDQVERLDWKIKTVDGKSGSGKGDARVKELTKFFRKPDGCTPFATWLRESLEDLFVIDAPTFEKRRDRGGKLIGLDIVPGDTIKLLVDETGRRPQAPLPAYQQIIKGMVWNNLTTQDLIYAPRNPRPNHMYGFSPVEQIIVTIETVMRRQGVQLSYFTEGNVPAGILNVPEGWNADNIKTMQDAWDARIEGAANYKNKLQWVPASTKYQAFKDSPLKDEFDEWLYRIACFAFSLPPTAFIKQMNRATAQQGSDSGKEEGIESRKLWWKRVADDIIQEEFGYDDLEWGWNEDVEVDPVKQATIDDLNLKNGSATLDEVRDARGMDALPDKAGQQAMIYLPTGPVVVSRAVEDSLNPPDPPPVIMAPPGVHPGATQGAESGEQNAPKKPEPTHGADVSADDAKAKLAKAAEHITADRPKARRAQRRLRKIIASALTSTGEDVAAQVERALSKIGKAADDAGNIAKAQAIASGVSLNELDALVEGVFDDLFEVAYDSAKLGAAAVGVTDTDDLTNQVNSRAVAFARARAAEMVSVQGPKNIVQPTRNMIRDVIAQGLEDNIGADAIAENVQASTAFTGERADLIAKTEIANANGQGKLEGWRAAQALGLSLEKFWQVSNNGSCCDDCADNAAASPIPLDDDFPSGDSAEPGHPNCECVTYARAVSGAGDEDEED